MCRLEKNACQWSQDLLRKLLVGLKIEDPSVGVVEITELTSIEGEAAAYNRKAKLIFFYEWVIKGCWEGCLNGNETKINGKFEIPNVSEENSADEIDVQVTVDEESRKTKGADVLKEMVHKKGTGLIQGKIAEYVTKLKNDFAKDLIKPTKDQVQSTSNSGVNLVKETSSKLHINNSTNSKVTTASKPSAPSTGFDARDLTLSEELKCKSEEIFRVFITSELMSAFSRGNATVDPVIGGTFSMFDGNISGSFTKIVPNEVIEQKWRFKQWPEGYHSDVTITFEEKTDHTLVTINQKGIPSNDYDRTENGWKVNYFRSIKQCFGFGAMLY